MNNKVDDGPGVEILAEAKRAILDMLAGGQRTPTELRKEVGLATAPRLYTLAMKELEREKMVRWNPNLRLWSRA